MLIIAIGPSTAGETTPSATGSTADSSGDTSSEVSALKHPHLGTVSVHELPQSTLMNILDGDGEQAAHGQ